MNAERCTICSRAIDSLIFLAGGRFLAEFAQFNRTKSKNTKIVHKQLLLLDLLGIFH